MKYDYNGYTDWNMALSMVGGPYIAFPADASVVINHDYEEFYKQPMFYMFGHFSKFVRPDSVRVRASLVNEHSQSNITVVAFQRPDNLTAVVLYNG